jgi:prevent-host-death family protein
MIVPAGEFKAKCLKMMDEVQNRRVHITVTKHGKPVVSVVPFDPPQPKKAFGVLAGSLTVNGDLIEPTGEAWEADV